MRCSICGKEFGDGIKCQNCGVDRFTGLGNYNGYDRPTGNHEYYNSRGSSRYSSNNGEFASTKTTICYACSEIIPAESMFCPYCKKELLVTCPKCGKIYSTQYSVCNKCGTDRHDYYLKQEARKQEARRREKEREQAELEERKRQEEEANKEKTANTVVYFIMIPIWGAMWYAFFKNGIPSLIQIPEVWPNTFPTDIIMCLLLGYLTQYIITNYFD